MKNIIILSLLALFFTYTAESQFLQKKLATEPLPTARERAVVDGIVDPELIFVASLNQDIELFETVLEMRFDLMTGKGDMWIYIFTNEARTDFRAYTLFKPMLGGYFIEEIPAEEILESGLPIALEQSLDDFEWENSDKAAGALSSSKAFSDFYALEPDVFMIALFLNGGLPGVEFGDPMWGAIMEKDGSEQMCSAHAISLEVQCLLEASVNDVIANSLMIYPNPTSDYLVIHLHDINPTVNRMAENTDIEVQIFNVLGAEIQNFTSSLSVGDKVRVNVSDLQHGAYFVKIGNRFVPFVKE
ncbi:MAG: T9SS type A sorting domain-containing protein [Desulfobulbaceae bacterium]|nr:T9SS type A sorting domain-containing protein [Candidatus Kapabacteria bacterium]MBS3998873.1 T9SS type A sorting domain-containing protein [Desulfobulbaceae bacterium]